MVYIDKRRDKALREMERVGKDKKYLRGGVPQWGGEGQSAILAGDLWGILYPGRVGVVV